MQHVHRILAPKHQHHVCSRPKGRDVSHYVSVFVFISMCDAPSSTSSPEGIRKRKGLGEQCDACMHFALVVHLSGGRRALRSHCRGLRRQLQVISCRVRICLSSHNRPSYYRICRIMRGATWLDVLAALFPNAPSRWNELRLVFVANGLFHWTQLDKVKDLTSLTGVERLSDAEVKALCELQHNGQQTPQSPRRAACQAQVLVQAVTVGNMDCVPAKLELRSAEKGKGPMAAVESVKQCALSPQGRAQWVETAIFAS
jgi:hypothetical protein